MDRFCLAYSLLKLHLSLLLCNKPHWKLVAQNSKHWLLVTSLRVSWPHTHQQSPQGGGGSCPYHGWILTCLGVSRWKMIYDGLELRQTALDSSMWPLFFCQRLILSWACLQGGRVLKTQLSRDSGGPALNWHYHFCHILSQRKWQNQSRLKVKKKKKRFLLFKEKDAKPYLTLYMDAGRERIGTLSTNNLSQHGQSLLWNDFP